MKEQCQNCGSTELLSSGVYVRCLDCHITFDPETGIEIEEDLPECPSCGPGTIVEEEDSNTLWCQTCGGNFRTETGEEVEPHLQFSFYDEQIGAMEEAVSEAESRADRIESENEELMQAHKEIADTLDALVRRLDIAKAFGRADIMFEVIYRELPVFAVRVREFADGDSTFF